MWSSWLYNLEPNIILNLILNSYLNFLKPTAASQKASKNVKGELYVSTLCFTYTAFWLTWKTYGFVSYYIGCI